MSKKLLFSYPVQGQNATTLVPTNQSLSASFNSAVTNVDFHDTLAYQINVTTSDSTGNFFFQGSLDGVNFVDLLACGTIAATNDTILLNATAVAFKQVRLRYAPAVAGTGTCVIYLTAKTVGT